MRYFLILLFCIPISNNTFSQKNDTVLVNQITISGNKKTHEKIFLREITFKQGDTLPDVAGAFKTSRENLLNTRLFHYVTFESIRQAGRINVSIDVQERWYLWPVPIFEYADPNLATWLRRREIDYVNYGIVLEQRNFRGLNQKVQLKIRRGVREQYALVYHIPQLGNYDDWGAYTDLSVFRQKEIHHKIVDKVYQDYVADHYIYHEGRFLAGLEYRPGYYSRHLFFGGYRELRYDGVIDSVFEMPVNRKQQYLTAAYRFKYFKGDYVMYPLSGNKLYFKSELGVGQEHYAYSDFRLGIHRNVAKRLTFSYGLDGFISYTPNYPYFIYAGPGRTWYIRGFEDYMYHQDLLLLNRFQLKFALLQKQTFKLDFVPSEKFNEPYLGIYLNGFTEVGYGTNMYGKARKIAPMSVGLGIDFLTYYDWIGRVEVAYNNSNETWFNIHYGYVF